MFKLMHPELSYQVRGVLLDVYDVLGPTLKERYYLANFHGTRLAIMPVRFTPKKAT